MAPETFFDDQVIQISNIKAVYITDPFYLTVSYYNETPSFQLAALHFQLETSSFTINTQFTTYKCPSYSVYII